MLHRTGFGLHKQGFALGCIWAHTGGSGSVSEAPAMDRLDTRISVHTPLFLPFWQKHSIIFALLGAVGFWEKSGSFMGVWGEKFCEKFF